MDIVLVDGVNFGSSEENIPQLGLVSLRNQLKHEFSVEIVDFDYMHFIKKYVYDNDYDVAINHMAEYLARKNALVYGFYTMCNTYPVTVLTAKRLKQLKPDSQIIFGGPHATLTAEESLNSFSFLDAIGLGEGEKYIRDFVNTLIIGGDLNKVNGVCFRDKGRIVCTELPELLGVDELNEMNLADMIKDCDNIYKLNASGSDETPIEGFPLEGGRGCPFSCTFCSTNKFWKRCFRAKSVKSLIQEMKDLNTEYGHTVFVFNHDHFTFKKEYLHEFCDALIREDLKFKWTCSSRIDTLDYDSIELMKNSGCIGIFVGIETGSKRMQWNIRKNINIEDAFDKIIYIKKQGFRVVVSFIYGFADETLDDFADTMGMIDKLLLNNIRTLQLHKLMPLPKTKEFEKLAGKMYFDENDIELSIYTEKSTSRSVVELIKNHPDIFPQFYTVDSEVRTKYRRMDFMIYGLMAVYKEGYLSIRYLLKKYGSVGIYEFVQDEVEIAFEQLKAAGLNLFQKESMEIFKKLYSAIMIKMNKVEDDSYFSRIAISESQKVYMIEVALG
ncbi:hypothetical protein FACS1894127_6430 [Clostridia bacterium]|nr:hypothetical protein FACS1894127_6430 [Clostridia bacterium]